MMIKVEVRILIRGRCAFRWAVESQCQPEQPMSKCTGTYGLVKAKQPRNVGSTRGFERGTAPNKAKADLRERKRDCGRRKTLHKARVNACDSDTGGVWNALYVSEGGERQRRWNERLNIRSENIKAKE